MSKMILLFIALLLSGFTASSQATIPSFAIVEDGKLIFYNEAGNTQEIIEASGFFDMTWNRDGTKLAFFLYDAMFDSKLGIFDVSTGEVVFPATRRPSIGYPINWTTEGEILFISNVNDTGELEFGERGLKSTLYRIAPEPDAQEIALGTFESIGECGGASMLPVDWVFAAETSSLGGFYLTLEETPYGIVHSVDCSGSILALLDVETGESQLVAENFSKAVISPDKSKIAGVQLNTKDRTVSKLTVYDLKTGKMREILTEGEPDQLTWSDQGNSIYYTVRTLADNPVDGLNNAQKNRLSRILDYNVEELPAYNTSIYQISVESSENFEVFSGAVLSSNAYAIVRLVDTSEGLFFTTIPNLNQWLDAVTSGRLQYNPVATTEIEFIQPTVLLLQDGASDAAFLGMYGQFTPVVYR